MPTRELPHYWTPEQVRQILATMPAGRPWLFALLLWRSALRQAEALDLQWWDLNFAAAPAPTITVRKGKEGRSRVVLAHPELVDVYGRCLNQSQGGMCICRVLGIGAGVSRECFGP